MRNAASAELEWVLTGKSGEPVGGGTDQLTCWIDSETRV